MWNVLCFLSEYNNSTLKILSVTSKIYCWGGGGGVRGAEMKNKLILEGARVNLMILLSGCHLLN